MPEEFQYTPPNNKAQKTKEKEEAVREGKTLIDFSSTPLSSLSSN